MTEIEKAIDHYQYGISHDIFSEPVTTYAILAITALREKQAREQECEYCDDNFKFWQAQISGELPNVRFCPMCGRGLEVQHE